MSEAHRVSCGPHMRRYSRFSYSVRSRLLRTGEAGSSNELWELAPVDLTPSFHPAATRDRRLLLASSLVASTGRAAANFKPSACSAGVW